MHTAGYHVIDVMHTLPPSLLALLCVLTQHFAVEASRLLSVVKQAPLQVPLTLL